MCVCVLIVHVCVRLDCACVDICGAGVCMCDVWVGCVSAYSHIHVVIPPQPPLITHLSRPTHLTPTSITHLSSPTSHHPPLITHLSRPTHLTPTSTTYLELLKSVAIQRVVGNAFAILERHIVHHPECQGARPCAGKVCDGIEQGHVRTPNGGVTYPSMEGHYRDKHGVRGHLVERKRERERVCVCG